MDSPESKSQINVRLDAELRSALEQLAKSEDRTLSSLIRHALRETAALRQAQSGVAS